MLSVLGVFIAAGSAFAADEICAKCGPDVSVSGNFAHYKINDSTVIEGAGNDAAAFREEIYGENFTVSIAHLPAGKYTVSIGATEVYATAPGQRIFSVTCGDVSLAKNFDIFATAGGARKICYIDVTELFRTS